MRKADEHQRAHHQHNDCQNLDHHQDILHCGAGFDAEGVQTRPPPGRLGLLGMRERLALVGGLLMVESTPDKGTTVFARVPLAAAQAQGGGFSDG